MAAAIVLCACSGESVFAHDELAETVRALVADARDHEVDEVATELRFLGPSVIPVLLSALAGENGVPAAAVPEREALLRGLVRFGNSRVRSALEASVRGAGSPQRRRVALEVLGRVGHGEDVRLAVEVAEGEVTLSAALREATDGILRRDQAATSFVGRAALNAQPDLAHALVEALVASGGPLSVSQLSDVVQLRTEIASTALSALGRAAERWPAEVGDSTRFRVRAYLLDSRAPVARAAAECAGRLEDAEAVPELVEWLDAPSEADRKTAYWALCRVTGLSFRPDSKRWRSWLKDEQRWYAQEFDAVLERMASYDRLDVAEALEELREHPLYRNEISREVIMILGDPDPHLRRRACAVLGELRSLVALEPLATSLDDESALVRERALMALELITNWRLPPDREKWQEALQDPVKRTRMGAM